MLLIYIVLGAKSSIESQNLFLRQIMI